MFEKLRSLRSREAKGFTKRNYLAELKTLGYKVTFLYTVTGLPGVFEGRAPDAGVTVATFQTISKIFSPRHIQWRYDLILLTSLTDEKFGW